MAETIELTCPECKEKFHADLYTTINLQLEPGIKNKVLSGQLFDFECEHCHKVFHIPYPVLYHDMDANLIIQFTQDEDLKKAQEALQHVQLKKEYAIRIVDSYRNWIEKILIFDSGLDDRIMELYKLLVLSQYEDAKNLNGLYYWNIQSLDNPHYVMVLDEKKTDKMHFMPFNLEVYKQVEEVFLPDLKQDYIVDAKWAIKNTK